MATNAARPYGGRTPEERVEERRQRLLVAGRSAFAASGTPPSVAQVCADARVSKRHFYELFEDSEDLVREVHLEAMAWFKDGFDSDKDQADPVGWLVRVVPLLFARLLEDPTRARVLALAPAQVPDVTYNLAGVLVDGLVHRVRDVPGRPHASRERIRRHAVGAVSAGRALIAEWLLAEDGARRGRTMSNYITDVVSVSTAALSPVLH